MYTLHIEFKLLNKQKRPFKKKGLHCPLVALAYTVSPSTSLQFVYIFDLNVPGSCISW